MLSTIDISFVIPAYNAENTIEKCLGSILKIDRFPYEIIVIDDGSVDNTAEVCRKMFDPHVRVISVENGGVSSARNLGVAVAEGHFIVFVDADDQIDAAAMERLMEKIAPNMQIVMFSCLREGGIKAVELIPPFAEGICTKDDCKEMCKKFIDVSVFRNDHRCAEGGYVWRYVFETSFLKKNKIVFEKDIPYAEDLCFCITAFSLCEYFQVIQEVVYHNDMQYGTESRKYRNQFWKELKSVYRYVGQCLGSPQDALLYAYGKSALKHIVLYADSSRERKKRICEVVKDSDFRDVVSQYESYGKPFQDRMTEKMILSGNADVIAAAYKIFLFKERFMMFGAKCIRLLRTARNKK